MEPEEYVRQYREKRGYVRAFPVIMAYADVEFQSRVGQLADYAYAQQRRLSAREKELTLIAVLAASGAELEHLGVHVRKAAGMGIDSRDVLEALELIVVPAGIDKFERAVRLLNTVAGFCPEELLTEAGAQAPGAQAPGAQAPGAQAGSAQAGRAHTAGDQPAGPGEGG